MTKANEAEHKNPSDNTGEIRDAEIFVKNATINFLRVCLRDAEARKSPDPHLKNPSRATLPGAGELKKVLKIVRATDPSEFGQILIRMDPSEKGRPLIMVGSIFDTLL